MAVAWFAYVWARRNADNPDLVFGAGKVNALAVGDFLDERCDRFARRRAGAQPVGSAFCVDTDGRRILQRIERAKQLDETSVALGALVASNDAVEGALLGAMTLKSNTYGHYSFSVTKRHRAAQLQAK
jgi:hypothetical protein